MKKKTIFILILALIPLSFVWQRHIQPFLAGFTESSLELLPREDRPPAPDFSLLDLDGNTIQLQDYRGSVVLLGYWATW